MRHHTRPMLLAFAAIGLSLVLAGCGSSDDATTTAPLQDDPVEGDPFESVRHGYRLTVPTDWQVDEYEGTWTDLEQFSPGAEVPGEDVVASADSSSFLVMNSMAVPDGMTPDEWQSAFDAIVESERPATGPATTEEGVLAGQPATVVTVTGDGTVLQGHSLVHEDRGYYFTLVGPEDDADALAVLEGLAASIEFTD